MSRTKQSAKKPNRTPGTGSLYRRADGRWVADITLGWRISPTTGKRERIHETKYFKSEPEAEAWLSQANYEKKQGGRIAPDRITVAQFLSEWLESIVRPTKAQRTHEGYSSTIRTHVIPAIGHVPLQKLTSQQVQAMLGYMIGQGIAPNHVIRARTLLGTALKHAVRFGYVSKSVVAPTVAPRHVKYKITVLTQEQAGVLLSTVRADPWWSAYYAAYVLALVLGLRVGEYLGLRWADIDFAARTLSVKGTLQSQAGKGVVYKSPKSPSAYRTIHLPTVVLDALQERKAVQECQRSAPRWHERGYVFTTRTGQALGYAAFWRAFVVLRTRAGIPKIRIHDLRHAAISHQILAGIPIPIVSKMAGHSSPVITMQIYSHVIEASYSGAAEKLEELWAGWVQ